MACLAMRADFKFLLRGFIEPDLIERDEEGPDRMEWPDLAERVDRTLCTEEIRVAFCCGFFSRGLDVNDPN